MRWLIGVLLVILTTGAGAAPAPRYVIYLHGRIVQEQESARPLHPEHGYYELDAIAAALRKEGFVVIAAVRRKGSSVDEGAKDVVAEVRRLMKAGVAADRITVVGASMGASIALHAAARLQNPGVRFAVLGPCIAVNIPAIAKEEGATPRGRILSIREESDVPSSGCPSWSAADTKAHGVQPKELVLNTGLRHGFLYRPLPAWVGPVAAWARAE